MGSRKPPRKPNQDLETAHETARLYGAAAFCDWAVANGYLIDARTKSTALARNKIRVVKTYTLTPRKDGA